MEGQRSHFSNASHFKRKLYAIYKSDSVQRADSKNKTPVEVLDMVRARIKKQSQYLKLLKKKGKND